mmetsp:Transcript_12211/g.26935  ORF Transcript_12211/g.26935 Transcript_12211/m.26935 type:complete len:296 (-) Transcript_12211:218-1105(-)|eukprot:CAMPEP_0168811912 /NCGR_PEP_ID=MMETSP0726-20121227/4369_1 /TAXON_ID=265536 /ORGANISM="Amphiprora sp., Strain CCMP467" /LENGTH=295 /DNA_ID=CAMNT_0008863989 /DNA_START=708 /DNA_END=1595 /DNA_ORIENTATION=+
MTSPIEPIICTAFSHVVKHKQARMMMKALRLLFLGLFHLAAISCASALPSKVRWISKVARLRGGGELAAKFQEELTAVATPETATKILTLCCGFNGIFLTIAPHIAGRQVARVRKSKKDDNGDDNDAAIPTTATKRLIWSNGMSTLSLATTTFLLAFFPQDNKITIPIAVAAGIIPRLCGLLYSVVPSETITLDFAAMWLGYIFNTMNSISLLRPNGFLKIDPTMAMNGLAILYLSAGVSTLFAPEAHGKAVLDLNTQVQEQRCLRSQGKTDRRLFWSDRWHEVPSSLKQWGTRA